MNMRQIILDGRLGGDAKVLKSATGKDYVRFTLANDAYVDGTNKTDWFDITCFDPYVVAKKSEYLKKGRYAIVQGSLKTELVVKDGKPWLNHYVTATNIELPSFGRKNESNDEPQVSTYTGGTRSEQIVSKPAEEPQVSTFTTPAPQPQQSYSTQAAPVGWNNDDDLPF